jgi:hypothetical protein
VRGRQQQGEHRRRGSGQVQPASLGLGEPSGQGEPDAVPVAPVGAPGEEDEVGLAHPGALVRDVHRHRSGGLADGHRHRARTVHRRVVHEHGEHLADRGR